MADPHPSREVRLRPVTGRDRWWLTREGLRPSRIGEQYSWPEAPLQLYVAPARALLGPRGPAAIVAVDGRDAGYIGRNPLSGNLEYFLQPWARGGSGTEMVVQFLRDHRHGDRARLFFVASKNERSLATLRRAFERLDWTEGDQYRLERARYGWHVHVGPGPRG